MSAVMGPRVGNMGMVVVWVSPHVMVAPGGGVDVVKLVVLPGVTVGAVALSLGGVSTQVPPSGGSHACAGALDNPTPNAITAAVVATATRVRLRIPSPHSRFDNMRICPACRPANPYRQRALGQRPTSAQQSRGRGPSKGCGLP